MRKKTLIKKIEDYNEVLKLAIKDTESNEFFDVDTTIIGSTSVLSEITYKIRTTDKYEDIENIIDVYIDGDKIEVNEWIDGDLTGEFDVLESIRVNMKMIRKTLKAWFSENPDRELETEDEDED